MRPEIRLFVLVPLLVLFVCVGSSTGREWSSAAGGYTLEADLLSFSDTLVVLKRRDGGLVAVELKDLSAKDHEYVRSKETVESHKEAIDKMQVWTANDGMKVKGRIVAFGRKELVVQRKLGHVHVNDNKFSTIDPVHQRLILRILSELENTKFEDEKQLEHWGKTLGGNPKSYPLEGVLLQLESGDVIGVPFFLFASEELAVLQPGWELWKQKAESAEAQERESFLVRSAAMAYQRDRETNQRIEMLKLDMLGVAIGLTSIWQVGLAPGPGTYGHPMSVMVYAQNSNIATQMVLQRYPGYVLVGVRRASH
jgi:hypothetical protein